MSMEHNGSNQNLSSPPLCRTGCGFYGNPSFEGMCSKCFKDSVKRGQQNPSAPLPGHLTDAITSSPSTDVGLSGASCPPVDTSTTPSVETASTTVRATTSPPTVSLDKDASPPSSPVNEAGCSEDKDKKPKKNRCHTCKKKVGLTGFECRCGGLYCGLHRYSDKHDCSFDYKELGQQQIRKANPVVVGEKVQKI